MNVFFDVDDTLIALDGSLRPRVHEVFQKIIDRGHVIYIWSGVGLRWEEVEKHGLRPYVRDCYQKPRWGHRERLELLGVDIEPHFVVDDFKDIVEVFGGHAIRPYYSANPEDREMDVVYEKLLAVAAAQEAGEPA